MKKQILFLIVFLICVAVARSEIEVVTYGYANPDEGQVWGDYWMLQYGEQLCSVSWVCGGYGDCSIYNRKECLNISDANSCGGNFTASLTDYNAACSWCDANPTMEVCQQSKMYYVALAILYIGLLFFIVYSANNVNTKDENNEIIQPNSFLKTILYFFAFFMVYVGFQLMVGIVEANDIADAVGSNIISMYQVAIQFITVLGYIVGFAMLLKVFWEGYKWAAKIVEELSK